MAVLHMIDFDAIQMEMSQNQDSPRSLPSAKPDDVQFLSRFFCLQEHLSVYYSKYQSEIR
jgi:hypothetical protein